MRTPTILAASAAALALLTGAAQAQSYGGGTPEAFVRGLYARYAQTAQSQDPNGPEWRDENVLAPNLLALYARDRQLHPDEVGFVDADPVCQCQDSEGVRLLSVTSRPAGRGRANARVRFTFGGERTVEQTLRLLRTPRGWRIEDIASTEEPSYAAAIRAANRQAERERARPAR